MYENYMFIVRAKYTNKSDKYKEHDQFLLICEKLATCIKRIGLKRVKSNLFC